MTPLSFLSPFCHTYIMGPRPQITFLYFALNLKVSWSFWWKRTRKIYQRFANTRKEGRLFLNHATNPDVQVPKSDFHLGEENLQNPAPPRATASAGENQCSNMNIWKDRLLSNGDEDGNGWKVFDSSQPSAVTQIYAASEAFDSLVTNWLQPFMKWPATHMLELTTVNSLVHILSSSSLFSDVWAVDAWFFNWSIDNTFWFQLKTLLAMLLSIKFKIESCQSSSIEDVKMRRDWFQLQMRPFHTSWSIHLSQDELAHKEIQWRLHL